MFDIGWTEMIVVACVAIIVVGPKDLPKMLRAFGKTVGNLRRMAGDFQKTFNEAIDEVEMDDLGKLGKSSKEFQPLADAKKSMEEFQKSVKDDISGAVAEAENEIEAPAVSPATTTPADTPASVAPKTTAPTKTKPKAATKKPAATKTGSKKPAAKKATAKVTTKASAKQGAKA